MNEGDKLMAFLGIQESHFAVLVNENWKVFGFKILKLFIKIKRLLSNNLTIDNVYSLHDLKLFN